MSSNNEEALAPAPASAPEPAPRGTKKIRSQPPDVVVTVGEGEDKVEYECYSIVLCLGSDYFDAMFSSGMKETTTKRVSFPDKDPSEWEQVYKFIDPSSYRETLDADKAIRLLPWFHILQMTTLLKECDDILKDTLKKNKGFKRILSLGITSHLYGLKETFNFAEKEIKKILSDRAIQLNTNNISLIVDYLADHYQEDDEFCEVFLNWVKSCLPAHCQFTSDMLKNNLFPQMIFNEIKHKTEIEAASEVLKKIPDLLYGRMPRRKPNSVDIDDLARDKLKDVMYQKRMELKYVMDIPDKWSCLH